MPFSPRRRGVLGFRTLDRVGRAGRSGDSPLPANEITDKRPDGRTNRCDDYPVVTSCERDQPDREGHGHAQDACHNLKSAEAFHPNILTIIPAVSSRL